MYAAVPLALNLISIGAVCDGKHNLGGTRFAHVDAVSTVPCAMTSPTLSWVLRGEGRTVGSHTAWHCGTLSVKACICRNRKICLGITVVSL